MNATAAPTRVLVAMSGGVDSSVAAALLKEAGYDVLGITFLLWRDPCQVLDPGGNGGEGYADLAAEVASRLRIPHRVLDIRRSFYETVVQPFIHEYLAGRTPNPCVLCNRLIKFEMLIKEADAEGAAKVATGHYARVERVPSRGACGRDAGARCEELGNSCRGSDGPRAQQPRLQPEPSRPHEDAASAYLYLLKKGRDRSKDQSYMLYRLTQEQLSRAVFPLGNLTKSEVRAIARRMGLKTHDRPESQEICFVGGTSYREFLKKYAGSLLRPGPIVDKRGRVVGRHQGIAFYTVGQRKRLGVALGRPAYVVAIDPQQNAIVIGEERDLETRELVARDVNWIGLQDREVEKVRASAKIRYRAVEEPCYAYPQPDDSFKLVFDRPQRAITPGQSVVLYDGDVVLGGGIIWKSA